eukprot:46441_1
MNNAELVTTLARMGFHEAHCRLAVRQDEVNDADSALSWMLENPMSHEDLLDMNITLLEEMGFDRELARHNLEKCNGDKKKAICLMVESASNPELRRLEDRSIAEEKRPNTPEADERKIEEFPSVHSSPCLVAESSRGDTIEYGSCVALKSHGGSGPFMIAKNNHRDLHANCSTINEESTFRILLADDPKFRGAVSSGDEIVLESADECFVTAEADGAVNSNRRGPVGLFMKWNLTVLDSRPSHKPQSLHTRNGAHVAFKSRLGGYLHSARGGGAFAQVKNRNMPAAQWKVVLVKKPETEKATSSRSSHALWSLLARNFRLAAMRVKRAEAAGYAELVARRRREIAQRRARDEQRTCIVCWDERPNTVLIECGHICVCSECGPTLPQCPICRRPIERCVTIRK